MTETDHDVQRALAPWFAERLHTDDVVIDDVVHHTDGFSWQTFTMTVRWCGDGGEARSRGFVVRREPEDGVLAPYDVHAQYALHHALTRQRGVPVPALYWLERDPLVFGMPFYVMERIDGSVPSPMARRPFAADTIPPIAEQFVAILAAIHDIDWRAIDVAHLEPSSTDPSSAAHAEIVRWERFHTSGTIREVPAIRAALAWAADHVATSERLVLCHGDYRTGNFIVRDGSIVGILDWELAHVSDPIDDLAWAALPAFGGRSGMVGHLLPRRDFLDRYRNLTGLDVSTDAFRFWTVVNHVRAAAIFLRGTRAFEDGRSDDLRLAALGHRSTQLLSDLLDDLPKW
jgi:aminoglycoside phosphotransferase (APT) family kinase protein